MNTLPVQTYAAAAAHSVIDDDDNNVLCLVVDELVVQLYAYKKANIYNQGSGFPLNFMNEIPSLSLTMMP